MTDAIVFLLGPIIFAGVVLLAVVLAAATVWAIWKHSRRKP